MTMLLTNCALSLLNIRSEFWKLSLACFTKLLVLQPSPKFKSKHLTLLWSSDVSRSFFKGLKRFFRMGVSCVYKKYMTSFERNSLTEVFLGKGVLKICSKFTGEHPCQGVISIKLQSNFIEIALRYGCSPVICCIFSGNFFVRTPLDGCFWCVYLLDISH